MQDNRFCVLYFSQWVCVLHCIATKIFKKDGSVLFTLKAFNGRCVLQWLSNLLPAVANAYTARDPRAPLIAAATCFGLSFCGLRTCWLQNQ